MADDPRAEEHWAMRGIYLYVLLVLLAALLGCAGVSKADFDAYQADLARRAEKIEEAGAELEESIALLGEAGRPAEGVSDAAWASAVAAARERARAVRDEGKRLHEAASGGAR